MAFPQGNYGVEFIGPFQEHRVVLGGFAVPHLTIDREGDRVVVLIDHRFGSEPVSEQEAKRWIPMLANAMAVAAGYSCHGENCAPMNRFKVRVLAIEQGGPT